MRDERRDVTAHWLEQYNIMPYRYDDDDDDGRDAVWMLGLIYNNRDREVRWLLNVQVLEFRLTMIHFTLTVIDAALHNFQDTFSM